MSFVIHTVSNTERKISITIPAAEMENAFKKRLKEASKQVQINGYRAGQVPESVIVKRFGQGLLEEAALELIDVSFKKALEETQLEILRVIPIDKVKAEAGESVSCDIMVEVYPSLELQGLDKIEVEQVVSTVTDQELDNMIEKLRQQQATWHETEAPARLDDRVVIDFDGEMDGQPFQGGSAKAVTLVLGSKRMIDGFESGIVGMKNGDTRDLDLTFPADYSAKDLAGKPVKFKVTVTSVTQPKLPELDAAFFEKFNVDSLDKLKAEIRSNMERELEFALKRDFKTKVFDAVIKAHTVPAPQALVAEQIEQLRGEALARFGVKGNDARYQSMLPDALFQEEASKRVQYGVLARHVISEYQLKAERPMIEEMAQKMTSVYESPEEALKDVLADPKELQQLVGIVLEDQVIQKLAASLKIVPVQQGFEQFMQQHN